MLEHSCQRFYKTQFAGCIRKPLSYSARLDAFQVLQDLSSMYYPPRLWDCFVVPLVLQLLLSLLGELIQVSG
jgi:hypothetical protein